jgi:Holliday junction resolvase RusA-like endonuclease
MNTPLQFFIQGKPASQPRPRATIRGGRPGVYNPDSADGWKTQVAIASRSQAVQVCGAVEVSLTFLFARPTAHLGKKGLLASAPPCHTQKPDVDNLAKSTLDAMVACGLLKDDKIVTALSVVKLWSVGPTEGCAVELRQVLSDDVDRELRARGYVK